MADHAVRIRARGAEDTPGARRRATMRPAIILEPGRYAVMRGRAPLPRAGAGDRGLRAELAAAGERSAVLPEEEVPPGATAERGWRWLRLEGPLPFAAVGILAPIATALAAAAVPVFVLSTWETDHVLVKESDLERALTALRGAGYEARG